ncbi:hypothetical protein HanPSC8_Chr13g0587741 [Helianthus annuus]|nr:hypothetical protein HanPSC8_Chr13g0587741 [Helianthus annuus]
MSTSKTSDDSLSMTALLHSLKIQLSSTNFLLWRSQIWPLLSDLDLIGHVDGTATAPPEVLTTDGKTTANPQYTAWMAADRHAVILINSSLSEEAVSVTVGLTTARAIWQALTNEYCNASVERVHNIRDKLRSLVKGSDSVADFGRKFKGYVINYQPLVMLFLTPISYIGSLLVSVLITSVLHRLSGPLVHPLHSKIWSLRPKAMRSFSVNFSLITVLPWRLWLSPPVPLVVVDVETIVVTATIEEAETTVVVVEIMVFVIITGTPLVLVIRVNCVASMVMSLVRVLHMCRIPPVKPILQTRFRRNVKLIPTMLVGMLTPGLPII